jgi:uncharacterized membrane protein
MIQLLVHRMLGLVLLFTVVTIFYLRLLSCLIVVSSFGLGIECMLLIRKTDLVMEYETMVKV